MCIQVLSVRKFVEQLHRGESVPLPLPLSLPPDIHLQCGEMFLQLCEDPFEAKLRANYEVIVTLKNCVMCVCVW